MNAALDAPFRGSGFVEHRVSDWLVLTVPLAVGEPAPLEREPAGQTLLAWNAALPGAAKFVLTSDQRVALLAELPCAETVAADSLREATGRGLVAAQRLWHARAHATTFVALPASAPSSAEFSRVVSEMDWPVTRQSDGSWLAELDVRQSSSQARIIARASGGVLIWSELIVLPAPFASRQAIARLLLLVGGKLRWARPTAHAASDRQAAGFEIRLPSGPTAVELVTALSALSVGCQLCAAEINALLDENVALDFIQTTTPVPFP